MSSVFHHSCYNSLLLRVTKRSYQHTRSTIQRQAIHHAMPDLDKWTDYQTESPLKPRHPRLVSIANHPYSEITYFANFSGISAPVVPLCARRSLTMTAQLADDSERIILGIRIDNGALLTAKWLADILRGRVNKGVPVQSRDSGPCRKQE